MNKRRILIIIGLILIMYTLVTITQEIKKISHEGFSIIEYEVKEDANGENIKNIILTNSSVEENQLIIREEDNILELKFEYIEYEKLKNLEGVIRSKLNGSVILRNLKAAPATTHEYLRRKFVFIYALIFLVGILCLIIGFFYL